MPSLLLSWTERPKLKKIEIEPSLSEWGANATPDATVVTKPADEESTTTAPSLFDNVIATAHTQEADFNMIGSLRSAILDHA